VPRRGPRGIHKIRHIIVIMQDNRSFDSYFGTYPGANGIPAGVCLPDPLHGGCVRPHPDHHNSELGGPHEDPNFAADVDGGRMDGFVSQAETKGRCTGRRRCRAAEVMGYHTGSDIPNYWAYAQNFVLNDRMYESAHSWSLPSHMYMVSAWAADCRDPLNPMSCVGTDMPRNRTARNPTPFAWTDLTWLLHRYHVSWGYYLDHGAQSPADQAGVPKIWNVLPGFTDVTQDGQLNDVQPLTSFMANDFMVGARLDPATDGRPDSRPDVRESAPTLGNLASDFDFHQAPRPPLLLNPCPPTTLRPMPKPGCRNSVPLHFGTWGDS